MAEFSEGDAFADLLKSAGYEMDSSALFGVGADALRPIFRKVGKDRIAPSDLDALLANSAPGANSRQPLETGQWYDPLQGKVTAPNAMRVNDQNPVLPTPATLPPQLPELIASLRKSSAPAVAGGRVGYDAVAAPKLYDLVGLADKIGAMTPPDQRKALEALYAANPAVTRQNMTGKDNLALQGAGDAAIALGAALADPKRTFAQGLAGAADIGFKSYDSREDKALAEQKANLADKLARGEKLNAADLANYQALLSKTSTQGQLGRLANADALGLFKDAITQAGHKSDAQYKDVMARNNTAHVNAQLEALSLKKQTADRVELAYRMARDEAERTGQPLTQALVDKYQYMVFGHQPKGVADDPTLKPLAEEHAKYLSAMEQAGQKPLSFPEFVAKSRGDTLLGVAK